ncbi:MAG: hypothetical protein EPN21_18365 [Methylococcaceae bacterium]|nr:MAG: hypothetical protein EPN21_18365 [Methylococcaceae bacterium]
MSHTPHQQFIGKGSVHDAPWHRSETEPPVTDPHADRHPRHYIADDGLVAAVNTALLLNKPLLVTGNPGTGKSDLAERIAWELELGPVLRFEAQSLSEANDLFYRFDLVGRLAESRLQADRQWSNSQGRHRTGSSTDDNADANVGDGGRTPSRPESGSTTIDPDATPEQDKIHPLHFVEFGPFGKAILRVGQGQTAPDPQRQRLLEQLRRRAFPAGEPSQPQASVVLIDEIDKASRDFPNDLLNGIDRMEFRIRELDNLLIQAPDKALGLHPIVVITSNLERDLPAPFLRRCAFYHIPDPTPERLAHIVRVRVFPDRADLPPDQLPPFYRELLDFFVEFRNDHQDRHVYPPGTTEIIEASRALSHSGVDENAGLKANLDFVRRSVSAIAKHREDLERLHAALNAEQQPA